MNGAACRIERGGRGWGMGMFAAAALTAWAGTAVGQESAKDARLQTLLVLEKADLAECLNDPRDAGLKRAMSMIPARLRELPDETGAEREPVEAVAMLLGAISRPGRLAITASTAEHPAGNPADGMFGYGMAFSSSMPDQQSAEQYHARIKGMLAQADLPPPPAGPKRFETMDDLIAGPLGRLSYGPRNTAEGWRYEVVLGTLDNPDLAWKNLRKPMVKEMKPLVRGVVDLSALTPAVNLFASLAGPQNPQVSQMVREAGAAGLYGPDAMKVAFEMGSTPTESRGRAVVEGAGRYREQLGMAMGELEPSDFAAVPADAVMASISKGDLAMFDRMIDKAAEQGAPVQEHLDEFERRTGVDLRADVLATLGGTFIYYMSDATGGGNAGSMVGMVSFKDRAKFMAAHEKLVAFANGMLENAPEVGRYARLSAWSESGVDLMSLRFSGLPMPLEITYAATERWLIAGVTPQATIAAAHQVAGKGDKGLTSNESVSSLARARKVTSFSFIDTARMMRTGYPILSMVGSAVASGVRSPAFAGGAARDPGMIVPTYRELARDARPSVAVSYWEGDNYIVDSHGDRSALVSIAGGLGTVVHLVPAIAVPAAAIGAAVEQQQQRLHDDDGMHGDEEDLSARFGDVLVPLWSTPEMIGWAARSHPSVAAAAVYASGADEWVASLVRSAR